MIAREEHYADNPSSALIIRITYTDGLGRVIMHKAQATDEPATGAPRWIGSGRTIYNNKGKPVMQYEPYFSPTHLCDTALQADAQGISPRIHYDPLGRAYHTDMPDSSFSKAAWTGWMQVGYDANDTVADSDWYAARTGGALAGIAEESDAAAKAFRHYDTPVRAHLDSLGRAFYTVQQNAYPDPADSSYPWLAETLESYEVLDIAGDRLAVQDARGLSPLTYKYNPLKTAGYQRSIDGGEGWMLCDVAGQPLYHWDGDGRQFSTGYDALRRPVKSGLDYGGASIELGNMAYGEGAANDKVKNLRGRVMVSYDCAGKHYVPAYDFKGMAPVSYLRLLADATIADADWHVLSDSDLSAEVFVTGTTSDAFGRMVSSTDAGGNVTAHTYGKDGALKTVTVNGDTYVQDILHNALGQREAIWYGNGTKTGYAYDALSYRLTRLLTVNLSTNDMLQDLNYYYDAAGNITTIRDDAQQTIFYNNSMVSPAQDFSYDALYRLVRAEGREGIGLAAFGSDDNWNDSGWMEAVPMPSNTNAVQRYIQKYSYDKAGNITQLQHIADNGSFTRDFDIDTVSNRLKDAVVGSDAYNYTHDGRGNMTSMPHLSAMDYDSLNQMSYIESGSEKVWYQYSGGQRIRKMTDGGEERIYLGSFEYYRERDGSGVITLERTTVHVGDDSGRIAMLEVRTIGSDAAPASLKRFIYSNHLQSASLELDESGNIISYEEYHPYGTTAYQAMNSDIGAVAKRYRFTGKERDEESGLSYHGARYYIPWLCRWAAVDPLESKYAGLSPYNYCFNNPVMHTDSSGTEPQKVTMLNAVTVTAKAPESLRMKRMMEAAKNAAMAGVAGAGNALVQSAKNQHAFLRGLVKGIIAVVVVVAVIAAVAATGGVGAAVIAPMLTEIASVGGAAMTSKAILDVTTGKDTFTGQKLSEEQRYETGGELVGGTVAGVTIGAVAASGSGSSSSKSGGYLTNSTGKVTFDNTTSTGNTTFTETTTTETTPFTNKTSSADDLKDASPYYEEPASFDNTFQESNVKAVVSHLEQFGQDPGNEIMINRLYSILNGEMNPTNIDINFFNHELRESELMKDGMNYDDAHTKTLAEQGMGGMRVDAYEKLLYTQEAIDASFKHWDK